MGKDNLLLGFGRGKLGDSVFYRTDGEQRWRARNRSPKNPRSNKQLVQRAIMATTMAAYSAGRAIFDHSFQGQSVGSMNQRRFMRLNANALRSAVAAEWDTAAPEESLAKVTAPGVQTPIPNQYIISEGSYQQQLFTETVNQDGVVEYSLPAASGDETVAQYAARVGLVTGDIYTFVFIVTSKVAADVLFRTYGIASVDFDIVYRGAFGWVRLIATDVSAVSSSVADTPITTFFEVESGGMGLSNGIASLVIGDNIIISDLTGGSDVENNGYSVGLIRSRRDVDLRSNSTMIVANPDEFGLYWGDLLDAWKAGTTPIGDSELILEGGNV